MRALAVLLALVAPLWLLLGSWPAARPEGLEEAGEALRAGRAARAAALYRQALESGADSADLWYDLGCALFRAGDLPRARAAFEAARLRAPRDGDVQANLDFTLGKLKVPDGGRPWIPVSTGEAWLAWAVLAAAAVAGRRKWLVVCLIAALPFGGLAVARWWQGETAVVVAEGVRLHAGPGREFPAGRALPPGTLVRLRGDGDSWRRIQLPAGDAGFVRVEELEPVHAGVPKNGRARPGG